MTIRTSFMRLCGLFAIAAFSPGHAQETPAGLTNTGFEGSYSAVSSPGPVTGATASGWDHNGGFGDTSTVYARDTTNPHSGAACQSIKVTDVRSGNLQLLQSVELKGGSIYTLGAWVRGEPGSFIDVTIQGSAPFYQQLTNASTRVTSTWQFISTQGYVQTGETAAAIISMNKPGAVCIDDISLTSRPGVLTPKPVVGPIAPEFFGIHVAGFYESRFRNGQFYAPFVAVGSTSSPINGLIAHGWEDNSAWADVDVQYSQDTSSPPGGGKGQAVSITAVRRGGQQFRQALAVRPGIDYTMTASVKAEAGTRVRMFFMRTAAPYDTFVSRDLDGFDGSWKTFSITGPVGEKGLVSLMFAAEVPGRYSVGDVRVTTAAGKPAPSGITLPPPIFGTLRLWDSYTTWALLEPAPGNWQFSTLDRWVNARKPGQEIILTLGQSPTWASSDPARFSFYGSGASAPPKNLADWTNYIKVVAQRYKGRIKYYEVWNEPNDATFYSGSVSEIYELTKAAAAALKSVDPAAKLITAPAYSPGYLDQYLATGAADFADIIGYHTYGTPPEEAGRALGNVQLVLAKRGLTTKPLWDTEGASGNASTPLDIASTYMVRKYLTDLAFGASHFGWYSWGRATDFHIATVQNNAQMQTDAAKFFAVARGWLAGAAVVSAAIDPAGNWQILLTLANGRPGLIVWNPAKTSVVSLAPTFAGSVQRTLKGQQKPVVGGAITATFSPVLITAP